jgi:hypothetical protein
VKSLIVALSGASWLCATSAGACGAMWWSVGQMWWVGTGVFASLSLAAAVNAGFLWLSTEDW